MSTAYKVLAITQKVPALLSVIGSTMIISSVLRSKKNRKNIQQRLVCAMSFIDLFASFVWLMTNFFMPSTPSSTIGYPWTFGNEKSCKAQGFIAQFYISSILYNSCLSLYYLLVIKYRWSRDKLEKIEKWMHIFPLSFGLLTASTVLVLDLYNPAIWDCWIAPTGKDDPNHDLVTALQWSFFFAILWVSIIFSSFNMLAVFFHVRSIEMKAVKWKIIRKLSQRILKTENTGRKEKVKLKQTNDVAKQGILYIGAFLVIWLFPTIALLTQAINPNGDIPLWLIVVAGTMITGQGFLNAVVYFRLRFIRCGNDNPERSTLWVAKEIVRKNLFFWWPKCSRLCCHRDENIDVGVRNTDDGNDIEPSTNCTSNFNDSALANTNIDNIQASPLEEIAQVADLEAQNQSIYNCHQAPQQKAHQILFALSNSSPIESNHPDMKLAEFFPAESVPNDEEDAPESREHGDEKDIISAKQGLIIIPNPT